MPAGMATLRPRTVASDIGNGGESLLEQAGETKRTHPGLAPDILTAAVQTYAQEKIPDRGWEILSCRSVWWEADLMPKGSRKATRPTPRTRQMQE